MTISWAVASHAILATLLIARAGAFSSPFIPRNTPTTHQTNLFGIKGFRSWFESAFPAAVTNINPERRGGAGGSEYQPETFDHVLIDANQFLHTTLRRAHNRRATRSTSTTGQQQQHLDDDIIEYSLILFIKELNRITTTTAIPRKSLVIAIDGSPGAAKLDRQRRRRHSIYRRAESQERQIEALRLRGWRDNDFGYSNTSKKNKNNPLFQKHERERVTLNITPGTAFMDKVTDALLYWSWQYVSRYPRVKVYMSQSSVHGEGEVKLLDWITFGQRSSSSPKSHRMNVKQNETVAILGGDSDLVLMGLVVPPSITHNIHVILPGEKGESLVVSIWETTRIMARMIEGTATYGARKTRKSNVRRKRSLTLKQINQVRIDTTLLIILNGNDYLPKVKGCRAGFDSFFPVYLELVKSWMDGQSRNDEEGSFLINLDNNGELQMNVPFAIKFFRALASNAEIVPSSHDKYKDGSSSSQSQLGPLNNLVDAKILPGPIRFNTIRPKDSFFQQELWEMNSRLKQNTTRIMSEVFADDGVEIVRLTLGPFPDDYVASSNTTSYSGSDSEEIFTTLLGGSDGRGVISRMIRSERSIATGEGRAYLFEVPHRQQSSMKNTKERLSRLALEEIFGRENVDTIFEGSDSLEEDESDLGATDSASLCEKQQGLAKSDAASYLGGLLWNLETYLHGCCFNYGYDYGSRTSPTPSELVQYLESIDKQGKLKINCADLIGQSTTAPISDGLSCLAAVPPQAWHLVPEPYSWLVEPSRRGKFEDLYTTCFHPETRAFDIESFSRKCYAELSTIERTEKSIVPSQNSSKGRRIHVGSKHWTVISRSTLPLVDPFEPPEPFSDRIPRLRRNSRIRATKLPAKTQIERLGDATTIDLSGDEGSDGKGNSSRIQDSVLDIPYKIFFKKS